MSTFSILDPKTGKRIRKSKSMNAYRGAGSNHPALTEWHTSPLSGHAALKLSRNELVKRSHDLIRNDGWGSAALSRYLDSHIGAGWRLSAKPNYKSLGLSFEEQAEVADQIEALWQDYTNDLGFWADAERALSVGGLLGLAGRHKFADGEALLWIGYREFSGTQFQTMAQVIDPTRLSNPNNRPDTAIIKDGVELDGNGAAIAYHIRKAHPMEGLYLNGLSSVWERFDRETEWGRPVIAHLKSKKWAGMTRGEMILAPVIQKLRQVSQYDDFELQATSLNAVLAAYLETPMDPELLTEAVDPGDGSTSLTNYAESERAYYEDNPLRLNGVKLTMLHPGQKINSIKGEHPHSNYESFERQALRNVAGAANMSYEELTADFSQANYSSIRAALMIFRRALPAEMSVLADHCMGQIYRAWLEEVFDKRLIQLPPRAPSFEANPVAWSYAKWIGPGQGWVDPLKEAQASGERMSRQISTLESETAAQGMDWRENLQQIARENRERTHLGLPPIGEANSQNSSQADGDPDEADRSENASRSSGRVNRPSVPLIGRSKLR